MNSQPGASGNAEDRVDADTQGVSAARAIWRLVEAAQSQDLSPAQSAAILCASLEANAQGAHGQPVRSFQDQRGRIHITTSVTYTPDGEIADAAEGEWGEWIATVLVELRKTHEELQASRTEEARLQEELKTAETALEYTKAEVANLWRVMTNRNLKQAARRAVHDLHDGPRIITLSEQRERIRTKVNDVRDIARRRKWPWSMVG